MEPKEAVDIAKRHVGELFGGEQIRNLGLEEIDFDDSKKSWLVTLGFSRPWNTRQNLNALAASLGVDEKRDYKVIRVSDVDGRVLSIKNRQAA